MRRYLVFLVALFILGACGSAPPVENDWCYTYDFTVGQAGFNLASGQWLDEIGLQTVNGNLSFSYEHTNFVSPTLVFITVSRPVGVVGDIPITAVGTIYGVNSAFSVAMPTDNETVWFTPETVGDAGKIINVTIDVDDKELIIESIRVEGFGATPFNYNPCSRITPTIQPTATATSGDVSTSTPTDTPTSTPTPTETYTPTITNTPIPGTWCYVWDFSEVSGADIVTQINLSYPASLDGVGWRGYDGGGSRDGVRFNFDFPTTVTYIKAVINVNNNDTNTRQNGFKLYDSLFVELFINLTNALSNGTYTFLYSGSMPNVSNISVWLGSRNSGSYARLTNLEMWGTGVDPVSAYSNECAVPTPTPNPSNTPALTATSFPSATLMRTPIGYNSPVPEPTLNATQLQQTATLDATPTYVTPLPTITYIPSATAYTTATPNGTATLTNGETIENEAEWEILGAFNGFSNWMENIFGELFSWIGDTIQWVADTISSFFEFIAGLIGAIFSLISKAFAFIAELIGIVFLIINLLLGLIGLFLAYIQQAITRLTLLLSAFFTAPATPINGLPLCVSDPLSYDICAIYYIMDWTLLAPNTLGQYIIPLVLTVMNVIIIFRFVKFVLKIVRKGEDVTR